MSHKELSSANDVCSALRTNPLLPAQLLQPCVTSLHTAPAPETYGRSYLKSQHPVASQQQAMGSMLYSTLTLHSMKKTPCFVKSLTDTHFVQCKVCSQPAALFACSVQSTCWCLPGRARRSWSNRNKIHQSISSWNGGPWLWQNSGRTYNLFTTCLKASKLHNRHLLWITMLSLGTNLLITWRMY